MAGMADPSHPPTRPRVLIFIVAYEAETTLHQVLARIPDGIFRDFDAEVLVIDDELEQGGIGFGTIEFGYAPTIRLYFSKGFRGQTEDAWTLSVSTGSTRCLA